MIQKNFSGFGRILVGAGTMSSTEVIDVHSQFPICPDRPDFPLQTLNALGGLGPNDQPAICGGTMNNWNSFVNGSWINGPDFIQTKQIRYAGFAPFPVMSDNYRLFIAGGVSDKGEKIQYKYFFLDCCKFNDFFYLKSIWFLLKFVCGLGMLVANWKSYLLTILFFTLFRHSSVSCIPQ